MTSVKDIYEGAQRLINTVLRQEIVAQGHHLTGALEDSLDSSVSKEGKADVMEGFALYYAKFVNEGVPAASASFKQFPFLVEYFKKRGIAGEDDKDAKAAAAATIKKWMKEGMPTQASKRFSSTGSRTEMIQNAFVGAQEQIDEYMSNSLDFAVDEHFQQTKSETI